jgi:hypothetical protein
MKNNGVGLARSAGGSARYESISARNAGTISTRCADATRRAAFGKPCEWVSCWIIFAASIKFPRRETLWWILSRRRLDRRSDQIVYALDWDQARPIAAETD